MNTYTAIILEDQGWYIGWIAELPGANSQGRSLEELRENLAEAVQLVLDARQCLPTNSCPLLSPPPGSQDLPGS
jgi:predicted RNase H-like HicB family nuclease